MIALAIKLFDVIDAATDRGVALTTLEPRAAVIPGRYESTSPILCVCGEAGARAGYVGAVGASAVVYRV